MNHDICLWRKWIISMILCTIMTMLVVAANADVVFYGKYTQKGGNNTIEFTEDGQYQEGWTHGQYYLRDNYLITILDNGKVRKQEYEFIGSILILYNNDGTGVAYNKDFSNLKLNLTDELAQIKRYKTTWSDYELIESIKGDWIAYSYDDGTLKYWRWDVQADEEQWKAIREAFSREYKVTDQSIEGYDEVYQVEWIKYAEGNFDPTWTIGGTKLADDETLWKWSMHTIIVLRKGNVVSVQYIPINKSSSLSFSYYGIK